MRARSHKREKWRDFAPLLLPVVALLVVALFEWQGGSDFTSHEVTFTDASPSGLAILPASCASNPAHFHSNLPTTNDGGGYHTTVAGENQAGATRHGVSVCITNSTGNSYFIPANTAAELTSFAGLGGWNLCAVDGSSCSFSGTKWVIYGASDGIVPDGKGTVWQNGGWRYGQFTSSVQCTNAAFGGDPAPGLDKACYYTDSTSFIPGLIIFTQ